MGAVEEGSGSGARRERIWKGVEELEEERGIILNCSVHKKRTWVSWFTSPTTSSRLLQRLTSSTDRTRPEWGLAKGQIRQSSPVFETLINTSLLGQSKKRE